MLDIRTAMRRSARFHADQIAIRSQGRQLTYAEAWQRGIRLANALGEVGVKPGDRVAVLEDNAIEAADFYLGAVIANVVRVPLYRRNVASSHEHMLRHTGCRAVVVTGEHAHELERLDAKIDGLRIVTRGADYDAWLATFPDTDPDPALGLDDLEVPRGESDG